MKYSLISVIFLAGCILITSACHDHTQTDRHNHNHNANGTNTDNHSETLSYTKMSAKSELFVQFNPLVVGKKCQFIVHITDLRTYKAIPEGILVVSLWDEGNKVEEAGVPSPSSPGIFTPSLSPNTPGKFDLVFSLKAGLHSDTIKLNNIEVFDSEEAAIDACLYEVNIDDIHFSKEQAWKIDFEIQKVSREMIFDIIHTSGEILPAKGDNKILSTKSDGLLTFRSNNLQEGKEVRAGEILFRVNSEGFIHANLSEKYKTAKAKFEKAKADFHRAQDLVQKEIIGTKEYELRRMEFEVAQAEYETIDTGFSIGGNSIKAPISGIVKKIFVQNGQFVEEGAPLAEISSNRKLILEADLSQQYYKQIDKIKSANFKTPYLDQVHSIEDFNGKIVTKGRMMDKDGFIPILFELDNKGELLPGSFAEIFLETEALNQELVIPNSAIMQDYEVQFVYVQTSGETYEKREIITGITDGERSQILDGLSEGEWVVIKGAYQIKIASLSNTIPGHGHSH